jgi:large subunit ribosomal protein L11
MATQKIDILIEGGKATAAPPLGPALGPTGVNIGQVVADINKKTADFKGMQVPVTVEVDSSTKTYTITLGTPPASALLKKEAGLEKGSGNAKTTLVGNLKMDQILKITRMKEDALTGKTLKLKAKEVMGTARSMGIKIEGMSAKEAIAQVEAGKFDSSFK